MGEHRVRIIDPEKFGDEQMSEDAAKKILSRFGSMDDFERLSFHFRYSIKRFGPKLSVEKPFEEMMEGENFGYNLSDLVYNAIRNISGLDKSHSADMRGCFMDRVEGNLFDQVVIWIATFLENSTLVRVENTTKGQVCGFVD